MEKPFKLITQEDVEIATHYSNVFRKAGEQCTYGENGITRIQQCLCDYHFYYANSRIGGAAMTMSHCGICGVGMMFGSTATDKLCRGCAEQHGLCIRCGADLEGKERRKVKFGGLK